MGNVFRILAVPKSVSDEALIHMLEYKKHVKVLGVSKDKRGTILRTSPLGFGSGTILNASTVLIASGDDSPLVNASFRFVADDAYEVADDMADGQDFSITDIDFSELEMV